MSKKGKISVFVFLLLVALIVLLHVQARRVMLALVKSQAGDNIEASIGTLQLLPLKQTIVLKDLTVSIKQKDSLTFRRASLKHVYLELGSSLLTFFFGGTLVIDKMECEGGELVMARKPVSEQDTIESVAFDLHTVFEQLKNNAVQFRIRDMSFLDFNLTLLNDSVRAPTEIKHIEFRARDLYLSADSIFIKEPFIAFRLPAQKIILPNGLTSIQFDTLFFSSIDNSIQLNDVEVLASDAESGSEYRINSDKVRVAKFDFESLYSKGVAIVDSVFLGRSSLEAKVNVQESTDDKKTESDQMLPYLLVRNLIFRHLAAKVQLLQRDVESSFAINNSRVTVQHFKHNPDSSHRLSTKGFDILIADYETLLNNENTSITFDTVRLHSHGLALLNFSLKKAAHAKPILQAPVFELKEIDWYRLLFFKKLIAEEAVLAYPIVNTTFQSMKGGGGSSQELLVLESLKQFLDVNLLSLKNASANVLFDEGRTTVALRGLDASILTNKMIASRSLNEVLEATTSFSFRNFTLTGTDRKGEVEDFTFRWGKFYFQKVAYADDKFDLKLNGLSLDNITYDKTPNQLAATGLGWQSAAVSIHADTIGTTSSKDERPEIILSMLHGGNTDVRFMSRQLTADAHFHKINTNRLQLGDNISLEGIDVQGSNAIIINDSTSISVKSFSFADNGSSLEDIRWNQFSADTLRTSVDRVSFVIDFNLLAQKQIFIPRVDVTALKLTYSKRDSTDMIFVKGKTNLTVKDVRYDNKRLSIGSLNQTIDSIFYLNEKRVANEVTVTDDRPVNERWKIREKVDSLFGAENSIGSTLRANVEGSTPNNANPTQPLFSTISTIVESEKEGIDIFISDIESFSKDSTQQVKAQIDSVRFKGIQLKHNDIRARMDHGTLKGLHLNTALLNQPMEVLQANYRTAAVVDLNLNLETSKNVFIVDRFDYDPLRAEGHLRGLEFRPSKDKQAFLDASFFQTNFIHTKIESLSFHALDAERYINDSTIYLRAIRITSPSLEIGRDKTHPFYSSRIKLLPTNTFQKLGVKFRVDSLQFRDGHIAYTEKSKVTGKEGLIDFANVHGIVRNIKNVELTTKDTLFIEAYARFLDSANVNLRVRESYEDTLAGFLMTTQVSGFHTSILNPVLIPLVSVEFQSGFIDTLQMRAIGKEHISLGKMKFLYRDLKVNFLDQNDTSKHSIKNYILKFAANTLVIRTNNKKRIGDVFELRDRNRAVFQYWVKMILSGVTTSVGAKSNRSQSKKYLKELDTRKLPPIDESLAGF